MLESSLNAIDANFYERASQTGERIKRIFSPPTLDEVDNNYSESSELRNKIQEMLGADAVKQLYAAILLWKVDSAKATNVLEKLTNDNTKLTIQARVGFSIVVTTVAIPARDFLNEQHIYGSNFSKEESLDRWALAVSTEKNESKNKFDENSLPKWNDVLDAREDAAKMEKLHIEIDRLKNGDGVAEKFYAAALLKTIDESESREILKSLLTEQTPVLVGHGDLKLKLPAGQVAESILNPQTSFQTSPPSNPIASATKWLQKNFFDKKSGD